MDRCENICSSLNDAFSSLGHGYGRAGRQEDWLIAAAERQIWEIMALYKNDFLIAETHLPSRVSGRDEPSKFIALSQA